MPDRTKDKVALYTRISSADQRADLELEVVRLAAFLVEHAMPVGKVVTSRERVEWPSPQLCAILCDPTYITIVVEHRDRLICFGTDTSKKYLTQRVTDWSS